MQLPGAFEEDFGRRLRAELDAVVVRTPRPGLSTRPAAVQRFYLARPLAVALIAALALGVLAAAVTRTPDPVRWLQPAVWQRALGAVPPAAAAPAPAPQAQVSEDPQSPAPAVSEHPTTPSADSAEPLATSESQPSAEPRDVAAPDGGGG